MKPELKCIGIGGQRRNGKDVLANYLSNKLIRKVPLPCHGGGRYDLAPWGRSSFATAVKAIFCTTFNKDLDFVEEWKVKDEIPSGMAMTVRQALTFIGDGFRKIQPDIWIETAFRPENEPFGKIFSDLRYINEAHKIHNNGGMNILVYRDHYINWDDNRSERELLPYILWCVATEQEGRIADWPQFTKKQINIWKTEDQACQFAAAMDWLNQLNSDNTEDEFFNNLGRFDLFVRAPDGVENLYAKAESIVLPYIYSTYNLGE